MCIFLHEGDGSLACSPSAELLQLSSKYSHNGVGTLACDQGEDVVYPEGAPGYVYDPTGYLLTLPGRQVSSHCSDLCQGVV